jgi:cytochrome P450 family 619
VLTSRRLIKSLIDRKSSIYSNRPPSYVSHDLITRGDHLLVMTMGETWRLFRKLVHQQFMESAVEREALGVVEAEARGMVWDFLQKPEEFMDHPKRFSNSIIMSLGEASPLPPPSPPAISAESSR